MSCKACEEIPPVQSDYQPKGHYDEIKGTDRTLKTYVIGPSTATRGLICVFDIFGFHPSTQQGADRVAEHLSNTLVIMPDFFHGGAVSESDWPLDTDERKAKFRNFMASKASYPENALVLEAIARSAKEKYPSVKAWGNYGLCWGGKLSALTSGEGTPFKAAGAAHPGRLGSDEASKIKIPFICLFAPEDGDKESIDAFAAASEKTNPGSYVETYGDMHHGWMGARARLTDARNVAEYERGYAKLAEFFAKHLN